MRPLEKSLEKLDDVRKKKLSEMIGGTGGSSTSVSGSGFFFVIFSHLISHVLGVLSFSLSTDFSIDFVLQFQFILWAVVYLPQR